MLNDTSLQNGLKKISQHMSLKAKGCLTTASSHISLFFPPKTGNLRDMSDNVSMCWAAAKMSLFHSCATTAPGRPTAVLFRRAWTWLFQFWPLVLLLTREWGGCLQIKALVATTACTIQKEVHSLPSLNIRKSTIYLKCVSYSSNTNAKFFSEVQGKF